MSYPCHTDEQEMNRGHCLNQSVEEKTGLPCNIILNWAIQLFIPEGISGMKHWHKSYSNHALLDSKFNF